MTDVFLVDGSGITSHGASQALYEARELRHRQDENLRFWRRVEGGTFVVYLSIAIIVTAASGDAAAAGAATMLVGLIILAMIAAGIEVLLIFGWNEGPDTDLLLRNLRGHRTPRDVDLHLAGCHQVQYKANRRTLFWAALLVVFQVVMAVYMVAKVTGVLQDITLEQMDPVDPPASVER